MTSLIHAIPGPLLAFVAFIIGALAMGRLLVVLNKD